MLTLIVFSINQSTFTPAQAHETQTQSCIHTHTYAYMQDIKYVGLNPHHFELFCNTISIRCVSAVFNDSYVLAEFINLECSYNNNNNNNNNNVSITRESLLTVRIYHCTKK